MKHYTGRDLGEDFRSFFRAERKKIKAALTPLGCTDIQMSRQFYYYYGFFTAPSGQIYYFSIDDVRHGFDNGKMLYRTATSYKDFTGGANTYIVKSNLRDIKLK